MKKIPDRNHSDLASSPSGPGNDTPDSRSPADCIFIFPAYHTPGFLRIFRASVANLFLFLLKQVNPSGLVKILFPLTSTLTLALTLTLTLALALILSLPNRSFSQTDSSNHLTCPLRISLLTCTPGMELYSTFGHSALRVTNYRDNTDIIFNYGTFDFNDPGFYKKFMLGKLLYFVSIEAFPDFTDQYRYEGRGITEQVLNLSCGEKENLAAALFENAREENKYYRYDFVYDNCTTRLRDMVARYGNDSLTANNIRPYEGVSFRNLIHEYLDKGGQYWSKLGIDILLGSPLDKKISNKEAMFLPDYLLKAFDSSSAGSQKLVSGKSIVLNSSLSYHSKSFFTPLVIFSFLFVVVLALSFLRSKRLYTFFLLLDSVLFFSFGALGCFLLFMWFGTDHPACRNNFNLLWALPIHLPASLFFITKKQWPKRYFLFTFWLYILLLIVWFFLPQQMNPDILPGIGIIAIRCFFRSKKIATEAQNL